MQNIDPARRLPGTVTKLSNTSDSVTSDFVWLSLTVSHVVNPLSRSVLCKTIRFIISRLSNPAAYGEIYLLH